MLLAGGNVGHGGIGGGYSGTHVLLTGGGYDLGGPSHTLNAGSGPSFYPIGDNSLSAWYHNAAIAAGDPYAAKEVAAGQFTIDQANAAAYDAAAGVYAAANDRGIAGAVHYATDHATGAALDAAGHYGAAHVVTNTHY